MKYQIWYMKPSFLRGVVGSSPDPNNLSATHVHLKDIEADNREDVLSRMRAEDWSPNGEALDLLQRKGLEHTTMTIGTYSWMNAMLSISSPALGSVCYRNMGSRVDNYHEG